MKSVYNRAFIKGVRVAMRRRSPILVAFALATLPSVLLAQRGRLPRGAAGPTAAPLPPEMPGVSRALAFRRSRLSTEGYAMISSMQLPTAAGTEQFTMAGAGTHAAYRYTDNFAA